MRLAAFVFIIVVLLVSAWRNIHHDDPPDPPPVALHVVDPRGDITRQAPPTTTTTPASTSSTAVPEQPAARARTAPTARQATGPVADIIRRGFNRFGPAVAEQAVHVAGCESTGDPTGQRLNPAAHNGQHLGLLQLSRTYHEARARRLGYQWADMLDPAANVAVAADIYAESGWRPWTCRWAA